MLEMFFFQCLYLEKEPLKKANDDDTQPITSSMWRRPVDSDSVEIAVNRLTLRLENGVRTICF